MAGRNTCSHQLLTIALWQVDVPFLIMTADGLHVKPFISKGFIDLVAYFKAVEMDARTNLYNDIRRLSAIDGGHLLYSQFSDTLNGTSPASMNGTGGMVHSVIEQYGDAVGSRNTNAHIFHIGHQGINAFQCLVALVSSQRKECFVDLGYLCQVHLMGH